MTTGAWKLFNILIAMLILGLFLSGCSNKDYRAPVSDRGAPPGERLSHHLVARGETLYSIAWRYNLDYRELARANGIGMDYNIYPGQKLTLDVTARPPQAQPKAPPPAAKTTQNSAAKSSTSPPRSKNTSPVAPKKTPEKAPSPPQKWIWPAKGKLIATFSSNQGLNKGIDIQGNLGEPVHAASGGTVVYSGSGLRGYGKLLIVKHSDKYLSAYAHNRKLLVSEGDEVKAGEKIAEMGSSGTDTVKLHFEIRYDGNPVDPLRFLPRR